jgi:biopolymer transport protein ExbD
MAGVDLGGGRPKKKAKGGGLKRPKHRIGIRIDMTPMVDIAFLLLIFYMVTTIFSSPLSMEISLPPKQEDTTTPPVPIAASKLLQMFVDKSDSVYYQIGENMKQPIMTNMDKLQNLIDEKNRNVPGLVMVLKLDQKASYMMMVNIIDAIQGTERSINATLEQAAASGVAGADQKKFSVRFSLLDMTTWDEHVLDVVKAGGTVE